MLKICFILLLKNKENYCIKFKTFVYSVIKNIICTLDSGFIAEIKRAVGTEDQTL